MKLSFLIGLVIAIVAHLIGFLLNDTFISGDRYRANYIGETKDDRDKKMKIIKYALFLSIPNIISIIILAFKN